MHNELIDLKPGDSYHIFYGKNHPGNRKVHVRAVVDGDIVVTRYWSYRARWWKYEFFSVETFRSMLSHH